MNETFKQHMRWDPYFLWKDDEFKQFWERYIKKGCKKICFVLGRGFDPRMCNGLRRIVDCGGGSAIDCLLIIYDEGPDSASLKQLDELKANVDIYNCIVRSCNKTVTRKIEMWSNESLSRRRVGDRNAADIVFADIDEIILYSDIFIDISALPKGIYFPIISKALYLLDKAKSNGYTDLPNLFIVVSEDVDLDRRIIEVGIDETPKYIHGYGGALDRDGLEKKPVIWIPILGEGKDVQFERIYDFVEPDEICPVLPSPSLNPRRGDNLVIEYHELLFDTWHIEPKNIIYGHERNPFEVYRQIKRTIEHYNEALQPLNRCIAVVSADSSKLISLGALLAVYELKRKGFTVGLVNVDAQGYKMRLEPDDRYSHPNYELFTLLLDGNCHGYQRSV